jgi:hypothetical protein
MAMTQAANLVEKAIGHGDNATITTDVSSYDNEHGVETGEMIQATTWQGKNQVKVGKRERQLWSTNLIPCIADHCGQWKCRSHG